MGCPLSFLTPTVAEFKTQFSRDFDYGPLKTQVNDADISSGLTDAAYFINQDLFANQDNFTYGCNLLAAHFMVLNLRASNNGLGLSGQFPWVQSGKSVGNVSESFTIPDEVLSNPLYSMLCKTYYGAKFFFIVWPQLVGEGFTVCGATLP